MTKLEELEAAWEAAADAWEAAHYAYKAFAATKAFYKAAEYAADVAWDAYEAELKKTQKENSND
jgi:hypothetical protein